MRTTEHATQFKRDYKRELKGQHGKTLADSLKPVLLALVNDQALDAVYKDHGLTGGWKGYRDCHIKNDLVLIYNIEQEGVLKLVRLGSHSELF
ncbi:MAG: type II toxin-antitoxin system YafQ family toxin [Parvibaculum sp.]|nr:type II toxin-antitoxin system YafQ family toxin [Parvibaculum sp.]